MHHRSVNMEIVRRGALILFCDYVVRMHCSDVLNIYKFNVPQVRLGASCGEVTEERKKDLKCSKLTCTLFCVAELNCIFT